MCRSNIDNLAFAKELAEEFTGLPHGVSRSHIIRAIKTLGRDYGFGDSHIKYLELLVISYTREADWQSGDKHPIAWLSVNEIARKLSLSRRRVSQIETELVALQAIVLHDYGNYRRFGSRDEDGTVQFAYGVDLRPLGCLWEDLSHKVELKRQTDRQWKETRYKVSALRRQIGDILRSGNQAIAGVIDVVIVDSAMTSRINLRASLDDLESICKTLQKWLEKLVKILAETFTPEPAEKSPLYAKISYGCEINCLHHIRTTTDNSILKKVMVDDANAINHALDSDGLLEEAGFESEPCLLEQSIPPCHEDERQKTRKSEASDEEQLAKEAWYRITTQLGFECGKDVFNATFGKLEFVSIEAHVVKLALSKYGDPEWVQHQREMLLKAWQRELPDIKNIAFEIPETSLEEPEENASNIDVSVGFYKLYPLLPFSITSLLPDGKDSSYDDVIDACEEASSLVGVRASTVVRLRQKLSPYHTSLCIIIALVRASVGEVKHINAFLLGMSDKFDQGRLNLDKSLYGLMNRAVSEDA